MSSLKREKMEKAEPPTIENPIIAPVFKPYTVNLRLTQRESISLVPTLISASLHHMYKLSEVTSWSTPSLTLPDPFAEYLRVFPGSRDKITESFCSGVDGKGIAVLLPQEMSIITVRIADSDRAWTLHVTMRNPIQRL